jgi:ornithine decarboxylase
LFGAGGVKLECEPGRGLVASSHNLLTRIKLVRNATDVFINDGIYGALLECAQVPELMPSVRAIRSGEPLFGNEREYTVYGPTCDPLDVLPGRLRLPAELKEGDYLEFFSLGAYGAATATRFNGYGTRDVVPIAS